MALARPALLPARAQVRHWPGRLGHPQGRRYGLNKISHAYAAARRGVAFVVAPSLFVVAREHAKSDSWKQVIRNHVGIPADMIPDAITDLRIAPPHPPYAVAVAVAAALSLSTLPPARPPPFPPVPPARVDRPIWGRPTTDYSWHRPTGHAA